jgi:hypothetical protein
MNTDIELLWVTEAAYMGDYKIALTFNDGVQKTVDLKTYPFDGVFQPLRDIENFNRVHLSDWTVEWYNGADIAPERLYELGE